MKRGDIPPIANLLAFECAARHQSISRAAAELHLTQGAVSRQIGQLELLLGVTLFDRTRKRIRLTDAGASYAVAVRNHLLHLAAATHDVMAASAATRPIDLAVLPTFATCWLIPRLPGFLAGHPGAEVSCHVRLEPFDFAKEKFDAAIHFGQPSWADAHCTYLMDEVMVPVAAPSLLRRHPVHRPVDLTEATLLHQTTRPNAWSEWFAEQGIAAENAYRGAKFDHFAMIVEAASAGIGVALMPLPFVETDLRHGRLVPICAGTRSGHGAYYLVRPLCKTGLTILDRFEAWLQAEAARYTEQTAATLMASPLTLPSASAVLP